VWTPVIYYMTPIIKSALTIKNDMHKRYHNSKIVILCSAHILCFTNFKPKSFIYIPFNNFTSCQVFPGQCMNCTFFGNLIKPQSWLSFYQWCSHRGQAVASRTISQVLGFGLKMSHFKCNFQGQPWPQRFSRTKCVSLASRVIALILDFVLYYITSF
jgi:hypothetical protein